MNHTNVWYAVYIVLTTKQNQLFEYIKQTSLREGRIPTYREMTKAMGVQSIATIQDRLKAIVKKGFILKQGKKLILNLETPGFVEVPFLGLISAGSLSEAIEQSDQSIFISDSILNESNNNFFALKINGDSMIEAGIFNEDTIICCKKENYLNGDIVAAKYENDITLKRLEINKKNNTIYLHPENKNFNPIKINPNKNFSILGKLIHLSRKFN